MKSEGKNLPCHCIDSCSSAQQGQSKKSSFKDAEPFKFIASNPSGVEGGRLKRTDQAEKAIGKQSIMFYYDLKRLEYAKSTTIDLTRKHVLSSARPTRRLLHPSSS
jgi:hypothetical protein